jgi:YesN/AraC family two-component response regulator
MKVLQFTMPVIQNGSVLIEEDRLTNFYNQLHRHKEMQLTVILKGEGTFIVDNYAQAFKPGDVYLVDSNCPHIFKSNYPENPTQTVHNAHAIHIFFDKERIFKTCFELPEFEGIQKLLNNVNHGLQLPSVYNAYALEKVGKLNSKGGIERLLSFIKLLNFFSEEVKGWKSLSTGFASPALTDHEGLRMSDIYRYTMEHYAEPISLETISAVAHITPHAFCKYFKKYTRKTYHTFLNEIRINEACKKMLHGDYDGISNIAFTTGFNSAINFNQVFKKTTGMSPSDYIRNYKFKTVYSKLSI